MTITFFLISSLILWLVSIDTSFACQRKPSIILLMLGFLCLLISRWTILEFDQVINPDEALMAANAMQSHYGWLNWNFADTLTAGPLDSMVLTWPYIFSGDITLFSTRLTGVVLLGLALTSLYGTICSLGNSRLALISIIPIYTYFIATNNFDFIHYTSELLPVFLISVSLYFYSLSLRSSSFFPLIIAALFLGCIPFGKLQATPIAIACGGCVLVSTFLLASTTVKRITHVVIIAIAACVPALLFLVPLTIAGGLDDFMKSYFFQQSLRIQGEEWADKVPLLVRTTSNFWLIVYAYGVIGLISVGAYLSNKYVNQIKTDASTLRMFNLSAILLPTSYFAISLPGRPFTHYLLLSIPAIAITGGACCAAFAAFIECNKKNSHCPSQGLQ